MRKNLVGLYKINYDFKNIQNWLNEKKNKIVLNFLHNDNNLRIYFVYFFFLQMMRYFYFTTHCTLTFYHLLKSHVYQLIVV